MRTMSLYNKIFIVFLITMLFSIGMIGFYGFDSTSKAYTESAYKLSEESVNSLTLEVETTLEHVPKDVLYLTNFHALKRFMIWNGMGEAKKADQWKKIFSDALVDFLDTQKTYYKIRVIGLDGQEIINAQYNKYSDTTFLLSDEKLQDNNKQEYFTYPLKLQKEEFFISNMNLNVEYGKIEKPFIPVIRYSLPIIDANGVLVGVFVANVYADSVLDILEKRMNNSNNEGFSYFLVDIDGNYLYNKDKTQRWNKQLKHGFNFNTEHFILNDYIKDKGRGSFSKNGKIYSYHKIHPLAQQQNKFWYVVSVIDEDIALAKLDEFKLIFVLMLFIVLIISFVIIRRFIKNMTDPLSKVTEQLKSLSLGKIQKEKIVYSSDDEVGKIVKSTATLVDAIETTIKQANAIAEGNFKREIALLGESDELGLAINNMTVRLKEITNLAQNLSIGNYDVSVIARSSEDSLGLALIDMVQYFEAITNVAESISLGELNVKYKAKGKEDRLGYAILQMIKYLKNILKQAEAISNEDFTNSIEIKSKNDELGKALTTMTTMLQSSSIQNKNEIYFSEGIGNFSDKMTGVSDTTELSRIAISILSRYVGASSGVLYHYESEKKQLNLIASFAYISRDSLSNSFKLGEGIVGQVALEKEPILIRNIKDDEFRVQTGTTVSNPKNVYALPLIYEDELFGVIELMSYDEFSDIHKDYLAKTALIFASSLHTTSQNSQIKVLLEKSQSAFEELQVQSEELQESNVQMEEQQQQLTLQSRELKIKNETLAKAKEDIDQRAEELEKASKYKSEFLANMSHELRTPLNSIILLSKLLTQNKNKTLNAKDIEKSDVINKAGNDLLLLINDILDLSKVESGNMELDKELIQTSEIIDEMKGLFGALAEEKGVNFIIHDSVKSSFLTDKMKFAQVMKNLLSNAFKFTKKGSVTLSIESKGSNIIFSVKDSGIGIPADKIDTIFEAFKQVDGSISREFGGTGLGLSITKTIIDLMDGTINVESEFGKGTTFTVTLAFENNEKSNRKSVVKSPKQEEEQKQEVLKVSKVSTTIPIFVNDEDEDFSFDENELKGKNILIVDDDSRNIFTLTSTLEEMEAEVFSAFNGKEAIELLKDDEVDAIDIILMDIMMPVMDGLKAMEEIKSDDNLKHIPIIAITAKTMPEDKQSCLDAGANDYLSKPLNHNALLSMLKAWLK